MTTTRRNLQWNPVLRRAAELTEAFTERQGAEPTLRQVHYALFGFTVDGVAYENRHYSTLSKRTAELRRAGTFPKLADNTRSIAQAASWDDAEDCIGWASEIFRLDRTRGQEWAIYLGVEKRGMTAQLRAWFGDAMGVPILPLGGTSSEGFERTIIEHQRYDGRPSVLIYAGDWDASGELILANFTRWVSFDKVVPVALNVDQVRSYGLPLVESTLDAESKNTHWPRFRERYREPLLELGWDGNPRQPVQVELDALAADVLRQLYADAIGEFWDESQYEAVVADERHEYERLAAMLERAS